MWYNVKGFQEPNDLKYYVEQPRNRVVVEEIRLTNQSNEPIVHLEQPMHEPQIEVRIFNSQILKVFQFANLLSLPHLLTKT